MRLIRRFILLAIIGAGGVAAYNYWSDNGWPVPSRAAAPEVGLAKREAVRLANRAGAKASSAAGRVGDTMSEGALTAKIKSKMALDDHIKAGAIDVDTSGSIVTLTGVVASANERERAVRLARDTQGVSRVVDRLHVRKH
jgi:osmotically-inducible protein OsmY